MEASNNARPPSTPAMSASVRNGIICSSRWSDVRCTTALRRGSIARGLSTHCCYHALYLPFGADEQVAATMVFGPQRHVEVSPISFVYPPASCVARNANDLKERKDCCVQRRTHRVIVSVGTERGSNADALAD